MLLVILKASSFWALLQKGRALLQKGRALLQKGRPLHTPQ